jgi:hypothetical protein
MLFSFETRFFVKSVLLLMKISSDLQPLLIVSWGFRTFIVTFSGNTDTSDMMYHGKRLKHQMQSTMKIKKKDLFTGTRSPNRSHVRSIQDVSHMNDKIGNCKDREEKNYESPKSPGNNYNGCKLEKVSSTTKHF